MREIYKEKDYVQYVGKLNSNHDHSKDVIAQIDNLDKYSKFWNVELTVIQPVEKVYCLVDLIRPIFTKKEHLMNLEFLEVEKENSTIYTLGNLVVSSSTVKIPQKRQFIDLGFCLGDLSTLTSDEVMKKYVDKDFNFDFEKFYNEYTNLNNINDLIQLYCKFHDFNIKKIIGY